MLLVFNFCSDRQMFIINANIVKHSLPTNNFSSSNYSLNRCLFKPFHLLLTNTKIINQYRLTYILCSELNSVPLYESERTREEIFIRIKGDNMSTF